MYKRTFKSGFVFALLAAGLLCLGTSPAMGQTAETSEGTGTEVVEG